MANSQSDYEQQQRIAPSTRYQVSGSPDQYRFVLRGADLVLIDEGGQEQVFLFVGNIMSLDGSVDMQFSDGQTLDSEALFTRSEMEDMDTLDNESVEWEVHTEFNDGPLSPDNAGNSADGTGLLPPAEQNEKVPAQAEADEPKDPTSDLMKLQQKLIAELSQKGDEVGGLATDMDMDSSSSSPDANDSSAEAQAEEQQLQDDDDGPTEYNGTGGADVDNPSIKLTAATDSGLQEGYTTNNQHPSFEGISNPNSTVQIYIDNNLAETVVADDDGKFVSVGTYNLNSGDHLLHAVAVYAGGETFQSTVHQLTIDTEAPGVPSLELASSSNTGTVLDGNYYTNDTTPSLHGVGGDPNSTVSLQVSSDGGTTYGAAVSIDVGSDGSWSYTLESALAQGTNYMFRITATDDAGNPAVIIDGGGNPQTVYSYLTKPLVVDTSDPVSQEPTLAADSDSLNLHGHGTAGDLRTNAETVDLIVNSSSDTASVEVFRVYATPLPNGSYMESLGQATQQAGGEWLFTVDNATISASGDYKFIAYATDKAGNVETGYKAGLDIVIDREAPTATTLDIELASDSQDSAGYLDDQTDSQGDNYTNKDFIVLSGDGTDANAAIELFLSVDGAARQLVPGGEFYADGSGSWTYTFDATSYNLDGSEPLLFTAEVVDDVNNRQPTDLTIYLDNTDPDIPSIGLDNANGTIEAIADTLVATVRDTDAVLTGTLTEGSSDLVLRVYDENDTLLADNMGGNGGMGGVTVADNGDGTFTWTYDCGALTEDQAYSFKVQAEDKAGNYSQFSKLLTVTSDVSLSAPTIELDASVDTFGGPAEDAADAGVGDNYTGFKDNPTQTLQLKVSGDTDSSISVYRQDDAGPEISINGVVVGNGYLVDTVQPSAGGSWPLVAFDASAYAGTTTELKFIAVSEDDAGNVTSTMTPAITVDDVAPTGGDITLDPGDDLGMVADDEITNVKEIQLTGTLAEGADDVKVTVFDNGVEIGVATVTTDGGGHSSWSFTIGNETTPDTGDDIAEGDHSYTVEIEDNAGNVTTLNALPVTIDRSIATPTLTLTSDTGDDTDDGVTSATDLVFTGTCTVDDQVTVHMTTGGVTTDFSPFDANATDWPGTVVVGENATWTYTVNSADLSGEGDYTFWVTTADVAGNTATSATESVTIDITTNAPVAPDLDAAYDTTYSDGGFAAGTSDSDDWTYADTVKVTGTVNDTNSVEAGSTVNLYNSSDVLIGTTTAGADGTTWSIDIPNSELSHDTVNDAYADHSFYIRYVDPAGNVSGASSDLTIHVDRGQPGKPAIAMNGTEGVDYYDQAGVIYTNELNPTFNVTNLEDGTTLNFLFDGVRIDPAPTFSGGSYTFNPADFAADHSDDGVHTISVIAIDAAGNASEEGTYSFHLDTVATPVTDIKLTTESDTGVAADDLTKDVTPAIEGRAEANATVQVTFSNGVDPDVVRTATADGTGKWVCQVPDGSAFSTEGAYSVAVLATDYAGNTSTGSYSFDLDTSIGDMGFHMDTDPANDTGFAANDQYTNNTKPTFKWTPDGEDLTAEIKLYLEADPVNNPGDYTLVNTYSSIGSTADTESSWAVPTDLGDGNYKAVATFVDAAGNTVFTRADASQAAEEVVEFIVDTTPPALTADLDDTANSGSNDDWLTNGDEVAEGLLLSGTAEEGSRITVNVNGVDMGSYVTVPGAGDWSFDLSSLQIDSGLNVGDNSVTVTATDQAGNVTNFSEILKIDNVDPTGTIVIHPDSNSGIPGDYITNDKTPVLIGTTEANSTVVLTLGGVVVGTDTADAAGNWSILVPAGHMTTDGDYVFTGTFTDPAGNEFVTTQSITIDTDPVPPSIAMSVDSFGEFNGTDVDFITNDDEPVFTVTTEAGTSLKVYLDDIEDTDTPVFTTTDSGSVTFSQLTDGTGTLSEGEHTYRFVCTDSAGNTSETTQVVKIDPQYDAADLSVIMDSDYDTGISDADGLTKEPRPTFNITAEAGSAVRVYFSSRFASEAEANAYTVVDGDPYTETTLADGVTTWDFVPEALTQDGFYKVTVVSEDEAGNQQTKTTVMELDTTPPETPTFGLSDLNGNTIINDALTKDNTPGLAGTAEKGSEVTITVSPLDDASSAKEFTVTADAVTGEWFYQVEAGESLADGSYVVEVSSSDAAGNVASVSDGFMITGETPTAPTISLDSADDSNINTDAVTNQNTDLTLTGIAQSHSDVEIWRTTVGDTDRTGGNRVYTAEAGSNGVWSADLDMTMINVDGDGNVVNDTYHYYAKVTYSGTEYVSELFELTVDDETITPTLGLAEDTGVDDSWLAPNPNTTDSDWETSNTTITGTVDEGATVVITVTDHDTHAVVDTATIAPVNLTKVGSDWIYNHDLSAIGEGTFDIEVTTTDLAGNTASTSQTGITFNTQTSKPSLELTNAEESELSIGAGGEILLSSGDPAGPAMESHLPAGFVSNMTDGYTTDKSLELVLTAEAGALVEVVILKDNDPFRTEIVEMPAGSNTMTYATGDLEDGAYTFNVTSTDLAGNEQTSDTLSVHVDAEPSQGPSIWLHGQIDHSTDTNDTTPTFSLYGDSDSIWLLYLDDEATPVATGEFDTETGRSIITADSGDIPALTENVEHTYTLVTVDRAGNVAMTNPYAFEIDTITPELQDDPVSVSGSGTVNKDGDDNPVEIFTKDEQITLRLHVEEGTQACLHGFGSEEWVRDVDGNGYIEWTYDKAEASHTVTVDLRDSAHNTQTNALTFDLLVDNTRPPTEISLKSDSDKGFSQNDGITSGDQLVLMGTILERGLDQDVGDFTTDIKSYSVTVTNTTTGATDTYDSNDITLDADGNWELTYDVDPVNGNGDYTATVTAMDMAGNTSTSTETFTVDNTTLTPLNPTFEFLAGGFYLLKQDSYLPEGVDQSDYKYELTFYGKDGSGNDISMEMGESSFKTTGGFLEVVDSDTIDTYDYLGIRVIDKAGNASDPTFIDIDSRDVSFEAEINTTATVESVDVAIYKDTDGDHVGDTLVDSGNATIDGDGNWAWDFAGTLGDGDYTLHFEGLDGDGDSVSADVASTYNFSVLSSEMSTSEDQDFSQGEADMGDSSGGGGGGGDTVEIDATVDVDHVEGSIG